MCRNNGKHLFVNLCFNAEVNVALNKKTGQSSTGFGGVSGRAVDGKWWPYWSKNSCSSTKQEKHPSWWVDLTQEHEILSVYVQNRGDCCGKYFANNFLKKEEPLLK